MPHSKWSDIKRAKGVPESEIRKETTAARKQYRATFEPEGRFFVLRIPELALTTQARFWGEAEYMVRDCIAGWLEIPADSFDVELVEAEPHRDPDDD